MDVTPLYQQIFEYIRREIVEGRLRPGDRLPSVRQLTAQWNCTPGTVQRAYVALARQGLIVSRAGQGTHVTQHAHLPDNAPLRRAALVHRAETFLLEAIATGHSPLEVEKALRESIERWQATNHENQTAREDAHLLRFAGSHDPAVSLIASHFTDFAPGYRMEPVYPGSLGGLMALAERRADLAGCHLWDVESGVYNLPFVQRILPGERLALVTLAERRLGLIYPAGETPPGSLAALAAAGVHFANRQPGSGTRVWLDAQLRQMGMDAHAIQGYFSTEYRTHTEVAHAIASGEANLGLGLENAAHAYHLGFAFLALETYHLVLRADTAGLPPAAQLIAWLGSSAARQLLGGLHGYDLTNTGTVLQVET